MTEKKKYETVKIAYDDGHVEVELKKCRHCGQMPTAEDAEKAVARDRAQQKACAVCGGKPKLYPKVGLYHSVDQEEGRGGWICCGTGAGPDPKWHPDYCHISTWAHAAQVDGVVHLSCLKKVAPGFEITPRPVVGT
jgi:hypothetical protein